MPLSRRQLLASASLWMAGCAVRRNIVAPPAPVRLARVRVTPERVIRTIVGLRPFRPSGFVVRAEKLDQKIVVHNYGHGGAGITLSWGTAQLAVQEAAQMETRQAAVIGCGVVGLSTARLLQQRGYAVTIYTKAMPPDTTSNVAGGLWAPVTVYDHDSVTPEFRRQFGEAGKFAFRRYQSLVGDAYGVRWLPVYSLSRDAPNQPAPPESPNSEIASLYPDARQLAPGEHCFDVPYVYRRYSMLVEPATYLNALLRDFLIAKGDLVVREFRDIRDLASLGQALLFNCTGLGSRELFQDNELIPIRGQLSFLVPQPEIDYITLGPDDIYMFPRRDGVLLGGSHERGISDMQVDPATTDRILRENAAVFNAMRTPIMDKEVRYGS
ncbi:MAG: FAD-dependent oxidoreductase [Bryobacteraceae bacterium]|jgi:glycine/D-amino acid oxidase-like deaminating enzyme